jgi:hypothetical protein
MSPMPTDVFPEPIDRVRWEPASALHANPWNPNRVHKPELSLLAESILLTGWVHPLLAGKDGMIIDGFHRWRLAQDDREIVDRWDGYVPVVRLDVDRQTAMLLTVRINRAKGSHSSVLMSALVRALLEDGVPRERIMQEMGATALEVDLLAAEDVFKARGTAGHAYGPSWYPVEDGRTPDESRPHVIREAADGDEEAAS